MTARIGMAIYIIGVGYVVLLCAWDERSTATQNILNKIVTSSTWPVWVSYTTWLRYN